MQIIENIKKARELDLTPALAYDRISDEAQRGGLSLVYQESAAARYAEERGLYIVEYYTVIESARKEGRRTFNKMLDDAKAYGVRHLLYKSTDRMSRNYSDMLRVEKLVDEGYSVHLYQSGRIINKDSNHDDKFILAIETAVARHLSDKISHDVRAHQRFKASRGTAPYPMVFGYTYSKVSKRFEIDQNVEAELRFIFDTYDHNKYTLADLADLLNGHGYRAPKGGIWRKQQLSALLRSPFYHGEFYYDGAILQGNHEPYYSKERFEERLSRLGNRFVGKRTRGFNFLFERFLKCQCGRLYTGEIKKQRFIYYHPQNCICEPKNAAYLREEDILAALDAAIAEIEFSAEAAEKVKHLFKIAVNDKSDNVRSEQQRLAGQIANIERKRLKIMDLFADGSIDRDAISRKLAEYQAEIDGLQKRQKVEMADTTKAVLKISEVIDTLRDMPKIYRAAPPEGKAEILRSMADGVVIGKNVEILWKKPFVFLLGEKVLSRLAMHAEEDLVRTVIFNFKLYLAA